MPGGDPHAAQRLKARRDRADIVGFGDAGGGVQPHALAVGFKEVVEEGVDLELFEGETAVYSTLVSSGACPVAFR